MLTFCRIPEISTTVVHSIPTFGWFSSFSGPPLGRLNAVQGGWKVIVVQVKVDCHRPKSWAILFVDYLSLNLHPLFSL